MSTREIRHAVAVAVRDIRRLIVQVDQGAAMRDRDILARDLHIKELEATLLDIVRAWEHRSELYRSEADCAAGLADRARLALPEKPT